MRWDDISHNLLLAVAVFAAGALAWHWLARPGATGRLLALTAAVAVALVLRRLTGRDRRR